MQETGVGLLSLSAKYSAMMKADLERVTKEHERISLEIAALQERLHCLVRDEAWLRSALRRVQLLSLTEDHSVGDVHAPAAPVHDSRSLDDASGEMASRQRSSTKVQPDGSGAKVPTLRDLIVGELLRQGKLLSSNDVASALRRAHPNRRIKEPAIRRTLEALVKHSTVQRGKRGSRIFYFVADEATRRKVI